ncbi:unnamed protein product, partial [Symbiodinium sp. KB8]
MCVSDLLEIPGQDFLFEHEFLKFICAAWRPVCRGHEVAMVNPGLNLVIDPTGKLLTKRRQSAYIYSDAILHFVTKFKHLARRARSSHQAQLRELKDELARFLEDSDSEGEQESQADEDEDSALSTLAGHDDAESVESSSSAVTPPIHIPALSGEMQMVLAKLQAKCRKQEVLESLRGLIPAEPAKPILPSAQLLACILDLIVWAKDDEAEAANRPGDELQQVSKKKKKAPSSKSSKASKAQAQQDEKENKVQVTDEKKKKKTSSKDENGEETEAMVRMKRTMTEDCAYVPGSYKDARLRYIAKKRARGFSWK